MLPWGLRILLLLLIGKVILIPSGCSLACRIDGEDFAIEFKVVMLLVIMVLSAHVERLEPVTQNPNRHLLVDHTVS